MQGLSLLEQRVALVAQQLPDERLGKLVVARRDRGMRREDTHTANAVDVKLPRAPGETLVETAFEQA